MIPKSFIVGSGCRDCEGKKYNKENSTAPTVCAEGTSTALGGSHESIHTATNEMLVDPEDMKRDGYNYPSKPASYEDVRDGVIKAHAKTFPFSACSKRCLKAQLDKAYKDCGKLMVKRIGKEPSKNTENTM